MDEVKVKILQQHNFYLLAMLERVWRKGNPLALLVGM